MAARLKKNNNKVAVEQEPRSAHGRAVNKSFQGLKPVSGRRLEFPLGSYIPHLHFGVPFITFHLH